MTASSAHNIAAEWPQAERYRRSIRFRFSLYLGGIILAIMLVTGYVISNQYVETVTGNVIETLLVQARSYSAPAAKFILSTQNPDALLLNNLCRKLQDDNSAVYWVGIADLNGAFIAHTDMKQVITGQKAPSFSMVGNNYGLRPSERLSLRRDTIYASVPITEGGIALGELITASSDEPIQQAHRRSLVSVASVTLAMLLIGLPLTMLVLNRQLRPISTITTGLRQINLENLQLNFPITSRDEFGYLAATLEVMGSRLGVAQKELLEKDRMARELEIARDIQARILPGSYPAAPEFEFGGVYRSAREIGGDYYDFIELGGRHQAFLVADVSGKSLPGMLVMLLTRDIVQRLTRSTLGPTDLLAEVNRELLPNIRKGMFVTMFYGVVDKITGVMEFASAGHNPLIHLEGSTGRSHLIKTKGYPLGMMPPGPFETRIEAGRLVLSPDDWLVQYTDGINEAKNVADEEFGMERFLQALQSHRGECAQELVEAVVKDQQHFVGAAEQYDDITLLAMKWRGANVEQDHNMGKEAVNAR